MFIVTDVTRLRLTTPYDEEEFESLGEAFDHIAESINMGLGDRFEIKRKGEQNDYRSIEVDARDFA